MARSGQGGTPPGRHRIEAPPADNDPIAIGLQALFETVAAEPVPDEFLELLGRIDAEAEARAQPLEAPSPVPAPGLGK